MKTSHLLATLGICAGIASAQDAPKPAEPAPAPPAAETKPAAPAGGEVHTPAFTEISPGVLQIGKLRLDKKEKSVTFPGLVNMSKDLIEYVLVTPNGSTHEALLSSEIQPNDLHFAMLLLGAKGAGLHAPQPGDAPPGQINAEYLKKAPKPKGDNISFSVKWKNKAGKEQTTPVEDWILNTDTKKAAPRGPWLYTGSMFGADGGFIAQQQGMFACMVVNPGALINNPRKGNDDDRIWTVNEKAVPAVDTPVDIVIKLLDAAPEKK